MKLKKSILNAGSILSSITMMLALTWLTISLPYVNEYQQSITESSESSKNQEENNCNPFSNTTEEKNESSVNTLSEYLHERNEDELHLQLIANYFKCHPSDLYIEFHPELISPPPEV